MDPANNNPMPNEAPAAPATPAVNPDVANAALNPPVNPVVAPTAPAQGVAPEAPVATPVPEAPTTSVPPVNPAPAVPSAPATMSMNQMFQPQAPVNANANVFDETTAISVPEGPKAPDPVEEELKAPLKAAGPVPGSIGSAVSMPPEGGAPVNNMPVDPNNPMTANAAPVTKKENILDKLMAKTKMSKNTLILLAVVCGLIVIMLIVVLIMLATGQL